MSSATPAAFLSAMSMTTTSASCLSATPRATVAPTFPAPPTTVTFRFLSAPLTLGCRVALHVLDNGVGELRRLQFRGAFHQAGEVVGDALAGDGAVHALDDQIRGFDPAHVPQHHLAGQNHRTGVHFVLVGVL